MLFQLVEGSRPAGFMPLSRLLVGEARMGEGEERALRNRAELDLKTRPELPKGAYRWRGGSVRAADVTLPISSRVAAVRRKA